MKQKECRIYAASGVSQTSKGEKSGKVVMKRQMKVERHKSRMQGFYGLNKIMLIKQYRKI